MKIPKNEILWETITTDKNSYIVTSTKDRSKYILYKVINDNLEKISTAKTPVEFRKLEKWG